MDTGDQAPEIPAESLPPMQLIFHGTSKQALQDGSVVEVVLFRVWMSTPDDPAGSFLQGRTFEGNTVPILVSSLPIMVQGPQPQIVRPSRFDRRHPGGR